MRFLPLWLWLLARMAFAAGEPRLQMGDIVFHTSRSAQSKAIQLATHSPYSHVGVVEVATDGVFVIEAVQPVSRTPWEKWRRRGEGGKVMVMRAALDEAARRRVVSVARAWVGQPYDARFEWGDEALYCSELVHKAFGRGAGVALGKLQRLGELDLAPVRAAARARYGGDVPEALLLVTPASIAAD
ncbi:MAG: YiiX/YebB-like N1pC/P60 family cysteine hydrolase, partial [Myxococcota bacterium]